MVRVPVELLEQLRWQNPELKDVSDTSLVLIILRRALGEQKEEKPA